MDRSIANVLAGLVPTLQYMRESKVRPSIAFVPSRQEEPAAARAPGRLRRLLPRQRIASNGRRGYLSMPLYMTIYGECGRRQSACTRHYCRRDH